MATLYITEYSDVAIASLGTFTQIALEPKVANQTVAIGGGSTASSAFNAGTRLVRLHTDAICSVDFGTAPTASATTRRMAANQTEYFGVPVNSAYKVAVITNT